MSAHVSRDGRDLVVLASRLRVLLVRDFERICRGETTLKDSGHALRIQPPDECCYLAFEHGRVCVATVRNSSLSLLYAQSHVYFVFIYFLAPWALHFYPRFWPFGEGRVRAALHPSCARGTRHHLHATH
jgi:hypothetical protein